MDPTARILRLLSLLQTYRHWSGDELSGRLEVSPRTLRRDVERLRELGYPVETSRGTYGGYQLAAGTRIPPLLLDGPVASGVRVPPRELPAEDAVSFVNAALRSRPQPFTALLRVRGSVDELRDRIPRWMGELTPDADGTCLLRAGADNLEWLALSLVRLDAEAELVEGSEELVAELTRLRTGAEQLVGR